MICFGLRIGDYIRGIMSLLNVVVGSKEAVCLLHHLSRSDYVIYGHDSVRVT